jgi:hypothetical protein
MSPMSLHDLPEEIKRHIEDESLNVVEKLRASSIPFILIGGWASRAIGGADHDRYTFDVDGVLGSKSDFDTIAVILSDEGMEVTKFDWGQTYSRRLKLPLNLNQNLSGEQRDLVSKSKIKLELSTSRIYSADGKYFFEFRMDKSRELEINTRSGRSIRAAVALPQYVIASKLGISDWKNIYDVGVLHKKITVGELVQVIESSDNWKELVRRKIVRFKQEAEGKIQGTAYTLLNVRGLNKGYVEFLVELQKRLT